LLQLEKRYADSQSKYIELATKEECKDMSHLERLFQDVIDKGGEGIILRDPLGLYQPGRSAGYLKHKVILYPTSLHIQFLFFLE